MPYKHIAFLDDKDIIARDRWAQFKQSWTCGITYSLTFQPVKAHTVTERTPCNQVFDKTALIRWRKEKNTHPCTQQTIDTLIDLRAPFKTALAPLLQDPLLQEHMIKTLVTEPAFCSKLFATFPRLNSKKRALLRQLRQASLTKEQEQSIIQDLQNNPILMLAQDKNNNNTLALVTKHRHLIIAQFLINKTQALLNYPNKDGNTALHWATRYGHLAITQWLIEGGAQVNIPNTWGKTPLHLAARWGHSDLVNYLISAHAKINSTITSGLFKGYTPLHWASRKGNLAIVTLLLAADADDMAQDENGYIPLHYAVENGHLSIVQVLREAGSNVNTLNHFGKTPLQWATFWGHLEIAKYLVNDAHANVASLTQKNKRKLRTLARTDSDLAFIQKLNQPKIAITTASSAPMRQPPQQAINCHCVLL